MEYRFLNQRLGYLPVILTDDKVVVLTFLFLTMDGTPEGRELYRRFRVERRDVEEMGLDCLGSFLASDIVEDAELVHLLSACGLDHLFEMARSREHGWEAIPLARDVRKYLRMPPLVLDGRFPGGR